jgi:hypothetical protein
MMRVVTLITFSGSVLSLALLLLTLYIFVTFRYTIDVKFQHSTMFGSNLTYP